MLILDQFYKDEILHFLTKETWYHTHSGHPVWAVIGNMVDMEFIYIYMVVTVYEVFEMLTGAKLA